MKEKHQKMSKDTIPDNFTFSLAAVDAIPVILFCINCVIIGSILDDLIFIFGALLCLWAGTTKVIWKFIVVMKKKNVWWMFKQINYFMPIGFVLMLTGLCLNTEMLSTFIHQIISFPSILFFGLGLLSFVLMTIFAFTLKAKNAGANWIEQITNGLGQACIFIGLLILV